MMAVVEDQVKPQHSALKVVTVKPVNLEFMSR